MTFDWLRTICPDDARAGASGDSMGIHGCLQIEIER